MRAFAHLTQSLLRAPRNDDGDIVDQTSASNRNASPSRLICPASKCPPITSTSLSAKRENSSRRVAADCAGSESAVDDQSRCAIWQGWWADRKSTRLNSSHLGI